MRHTGVSRPHDHHHSGVSGCGAPPPPLSHQLQQPSSSRATGCSRFRAAVNRPHHPHHHHHHDDTAISSQSLRLVTRIHWLLPVIRTHCLDNRSCVTRVEAFAEASAPRLKHASPSHGGAHHYSASAFQLSQAERRDAIERSIERAIFDCRFLTLLGVGGSLAGSAVCFVQGCAFIIASCVEYSHSFLQGADSDHVILLLIQGIDVYLMGTVMLIFGMGLHELFVSSSGNMRQSTTSKILHGNIRSSSLFGLFRLQERPLWLEIKSLDELKTKLGHVIVMILLVGMFEKSKKVPISSGLDLLCFAASILMSSLCIFLLSKLHNAK